MPTSLTACAVWGPVACRYEANGPKVGRHRKVIPEHTHGNEIVTPPILLAARAPVVQGFVSQVVNQVHQLHLVYQLGSQTPERSGSGGLALLAAIFVSNFPGALAGSA